MFFDGTDIAGQRSRSVRDGDGDGRTGEPGSRAGRVKETPARVMTGLGVVKGWTCIGYRRKVGSVKSPGLGVAEKPSGRSSRRVDRPGLGPLL